jgi:hypothetical protein
VSVQAVSYEVDESTTVQFEFDPPEGFRAVGADEIVGHVREALGPAVAAAREVLAQVRAASPDEVELTFGIKVSGTANWWVAKAATEGNFQVTMRWNPGTGQPTPSGSMG